MHWLIESLFAGGYFVRICSDTLTGILAAAYTGADRVDTTGLFESGATVTVTERAAESVLRGVLLLVVAYTVLWPFVVIAMAQYGVTSPLSVLLFLQLLAPTAWAGLELADAAKEYTPRRTTA